ncbi:MAG: AraC family transcriptional regulator [Firmicutes bacterium]|nr:AraC family transcriptional regulator [Bacillota bacterium]
MKVKDLADKLGMKILTGEEGLEKEIEGGYTGDLLSWVMSHASKGDVWITVQIHPNIIAVAVLLEMAAIIVPEDIPVEASTLEKANSEGIAVLQSPDSAFELCAKIKAAM